MEEQANSPSSSTDSSSHPSLSTASSFTQNTRRDLSTDLRLGLSLSTSTAQEDPLNLRKLFILLFQASSKIFAYNHRWFNHLLCLLLLANRRTIYQIGLLSSQFSGVHLQREKP
ncbi:hypothetical protein HPP92_000999 [Vanilla planifolia]|uniref:Uncharacterized protein n=1 Tax=Vanilla planifolia TaxID=51239 RepID=A0A835SC64_VANPL|nr:hypothetical protein HPP92_000999 [Vanilla planifolia]